MAMTTTANPARPICEDDSESEDEAFHQFRPSAGIDTNKLGWNFDENNIKASGLASIEFTGTDHQGKPTGEKWTVSSPPPYGAKVSLVIKDGVHAMVLMQGNFETTNHPGKVFNYVLMDRLFQFQSYRLVDDITKYDGYSTFVTMDCGTTMATADKLVNIVKEDLKKKWAQNLLRPREDGEESFCLYYAMNVLHALGVLKNIVPVESDLWKVDQMTKVIKFVDPSWTSPHLLIDKGQYAYLETKCGKVLAVSGNSATPGEKIITWSRKDEMGQKWRLTAEGYMECQHGYVLAVNGDSSSEGANLCIWNRKQEEGQKWRWDGRPEGSWGRIRNGHGHFLAVAANYEHDGGRLCVWSSAEEDGQMWRWSAAHSDGQQPA